jgi:hypothetical protein
VYSKALLDDFVLAVYASKSPVHDDTAPGKVPNSWRNIRTKIESLVKSGASEIKVEV